MVKGELVTLGTAAAALGGAYKVGEFMYRAKRLRDVGPSNAVYVRLIGRVRSDLDEVRRLLSVREVHDALEANPEKSKWVYGCMRDVRGALENITPHTERVGADIEDGRRVGLRHRVYWLLSEKEKLENREKELNIAHASLTEVLGFLTQIEPVAEPKHKTKAKPEPEPQSKETHIDIDIKREGPHVTERVEREVWVERESGPPPRHHEHREHRDVYIDERGPRYYDDHGPRYVDDRAPQQFEREVHIERHGDPRYASHYDEREQYDHYDPRGPYPEQHHPQGPPPMPQQGPPPFPQTGRRPESFEDRVPERDSWMQSNPRRPAPYGDAQHQRRFKGDAGFGDEEVLNPQPVPLNRQHAEREVSD
jgi:hypothetical protein